MMNQTVRSGFPGSRVLMQISGFAAAMALIAYFAGYAGVSRAAAIFLVFCAFLLGSWFADRCYPVTGRYRRSLPDTLKYVLATSLLFGGAVYLVLFLLGQVGGLDSPGGMIRLLTLTGSWFGCTMFLQWFGREPRG
tara:strand:- start:136991 stop:137398 length:408 start_codon:yes stop_codon:yes gene_type:complete